MIDYNSIGQRIREFRKARGWTQEKLAELSGIEPSNISHIERGATKLSLPTLVAVANALEVSLDEIVYASLRKSGHIINDMLAELTEDLTEKELFAIFEVVKVTKRVLRSNRD